MTLTSQPRTVESAGVRLAVFESGAAAAGGPGQSNAAGPAVPTVLLVHGYPDTHRVWDQLAAELDTDHHVVRYDVRGAGQSGAPADLRGYRLDQLADDMFAVADAVSADRAVHVVGHDWGSIQAWHAVTDPRAAMRIASFTTISGPCLDHAAHWYRRRLRNPTPRHLAQMLGQSARSWYITAFQLPFLAPIVWRHGLARRWGISAEDAVRGICLYRANMRPRMRHPEHRVASVAVQLVTLTGDRYVGTSLASEDLDRWAPRLTRRTLDATHWSALRQQAPLLAGMVREFVNGSAESGRGTRR